jgi:hypothetical protein
MAISWRGAMLVVAMSLGGLDVNARGFASADAARELTHLLDGKGLNAAAAIDPSAPGAFVAALYFPGSQLLVVRAQHPSTEGVLHRIATGQYREVYLDLQGTPTPAGKFFVQDAGADGILSVRPGSGSVDILYEDGVRQTLFNGDIRAQHLTSAQYDAKLSEADAMYARLLKLLTSAIQPATDARNSPRA